MSANPDIPPRQTYMRYLGLASQWLAMLAVGALLGYWIDGWAGWRFPWLTLLLPVVLLIGSLIRLVVDVGRGKKS